MKFESAAFPRVRRSRQPRPSRALLGGTARNFATDVSAPIHCRTQSTPNQRRPDRRSRRRYRVSRL